MKRNKMSSSGQLLISVGLLINVGAAFLQRQHRAIPDFITGALMGAGIGIMITALVRERRKKNASCRLSGTQIEKESGS